MNNSAPNFTASRDADALSLSAHGLTALPAPNLDRAYLPFDVEAASVVLRFIDGSRMMIPAADLLDPKALLQFADRAAPLGGTGFQGDIDSAPELPSYTQALSESYPQPSQAARFFDMAIEASIAQHPDALLTPVTPEADPMRVELVKPVEVLPNPEALTAGITETVDFFLALATTPGDNPPHVLGNSFGGYMHALRA